jgi:rhomboid family GlyGly-CTERM serine protease
MGLGKRYGRKLQWGPLRGGHWAVPFVLMLVCGLFAILGEDALQALKYDRLAIVDGEFWRLVTGHLAHMGISHYALNMAGLLLVWLLTGRYFSLSEWVTVLLITLAVTTAGFWFVDRNLLWYVGLSGILHGLLVAGSLRGLRELPGESAVIMCVLVAKLAWEQLAGPLPGSESVSGGNVIVNAHLYGAVGGAVAAGILWRRDGQEASI